MYHTQQYQHLPASPPPQGQENLPPHPVSTVTIGPVKLYYYEKYGGGAQLVQATSNMTSPISVLPNEIYMASVGKFYCK